LILFQITVKTAIVIPLKKPLNTPRKQDVFQHSVDNGQNEVVTSIRPTSLNGVPHISHYSVFPNFVQFHSSNYNEEPATTGMPLRIDDNIPLPSEKSHYYYKNPKKVKKKKLSSKPKVFKVTESIYYFPQNDDKEDAGNVFQIPNNHRNQYSSNDENQILKNSASDQIDQTEKRVDRREEDFDEAKRFENFLENAKNFGVDSPNQEDQENQESQENQENQDDQTQENDDQPNYQDDSQDKNYREHMVEHPTEDSNKE